LNENVSLSYLDGAGIKIVFLLLSLAFYLYYCFISDKFQSTFGFYISDCGILHVLIRFLFLHERVCNFVNKDLYIVLKKIYALRFKFLSRVFILSVLIFPNVWLSAWGFIAKIMKYYVYDDHNLLCEYSNT